MTSEEGEVGLSGAEGLTDCGRAAWDALDSTDQHIIEQRQTGRTLETIGLELGITRERVRQRQSEAEKRFVRHVKGNWGNWDQWCDAREHGVPVINIETIVDRRHGSIVPACFVGLMLKHLGWKPQKNGAPWWVRDQALVKESVEKLIFKEPIPKPEWDIYRDETSLPEEYIHYLLQEGDLALEEFQGYVIRTRYHRCDRAYVYLLEHGPAHVTAIAKATGENAPRNLDALMSRQEVFTKVFPGGDWALTEFATVKYKRATDAILGILCSHGPLTRQELNRHMAETYPVSASRIIQCLDDFRIGKMPDGKIGLVEWGARKKVDTEPDQPPHMYCSGNIVGVRRIIDSDILRGSGLMDSRWLAWKLGLHSTPMSRSFSGLGDVPPLIVTKAGANSQISALREVVLSRGLALGTSIVILLNLETSTWEIREA